MEKVSLTSLNTQARGKSMSYEKSFENNVSKDPDNDVFEFIDKVYAAGDTFTFRLDIN